MTTKTRPLATEEPPYRRTNSDGRLNAGCYEVAGALAQVTLAHRLWMDERPGTDVPPEIHEVRNLARYLVAAVDQVQKRAAGRIDRMAPSSDRASRAVRTALDAHPVPWGADEMLRNEWWNRLVDHATDLFTLALELVEESTARSAAS